MAKVVVIDDEAQIRRFLRAGFELHGFTVVEAENAAGKEYGDERFREVLAANAKASPDLILSHVLLDINRFVGLAPQHDDVTLVLLKAT